MMASHSCVSASWRGCWCRGFRSETPSPGCQGGPQAKGQLGRPSGGPPHTPACREEVAGGKKEVRVPGVWRGTALGGNPGLLKSIYRPRAEENLTGHSGLEGISHRAALGGEGGLVRSLGPGGHTHPARHHVPRQCPAHALQHLGRRPIFSALRSWQEATVHACWAFSFFLSLKFWSQTLKGT